MFDGGSSFVLRLDIAGLDKTTKEVKVAVEVSDSTLSYDLSEKKALYAVAAVEWYIVLDCKAEETFVYQYVGKGLKEVQGAHPFAALSSVFKST